jgi:DNA-directed RNA polymerase specialized sigma54-like protein
MNLKSIEQIRSMKKTYAEIKKISKEACFVYLDSIKEQCKYLNCSKDQISIFLGVIRGLLPEPGQEFDSQKLNNLDEIEIEYNKKL